MSNRPPPAETLWLRPGQIIMREGEVSRDLYVLLSGELKVELGGKKIASIVEHGEVIGEMGALSGKPRTATVSAKTVCEVLQVREVTIPALQHLPSVFDKIDKAVMRRYDIAYNKTLMYISITSALRRGVLQDVMRENLESRPKKPGVKPDDLESGLGLQRHQVRQRIDERLAMQPDADDPKLLERIATEYGVWDAYKDRIAAVPWLNEALVRRLYEIHNTWKLIAEKRSPEALVRKADAAIAISMLLNDYELLPGIRHEMDIVRMEGIVPLKTKIDALKAVYFAKFRDKMDVEWERFVLERKIKHAIDGVKADAGADVIMVIRAARELGIEAEYEEHIRNMVGMTETATFFVEMSGAMLDPVESESRTITRP